MSQELSGDPDLGLHAGELARVDDFDIVGLLTRSSSNVRAVFERFKRQDKVSARNVEIVFQADAVILRHRSRDVREPRRSVIEIARALGFSDTGAFYRAFKRWTGTSVSEYRRTARSC